MWAARRRLHCRSKRFDIPAGPLEQSLDAWGKVTGIKIKYVLPGGTLAGFNSHGVVGLYREEDALRLLLGRHRPELPHGRCDYRCGWRGRPATPVSVTAAAANSISLDKFTEPLIDVPQSVAVVPQFVVQDEGVSTLRDTLRNVPGISLGFRLRAGGGA